MFVVATANDLTGIPPEFLRQGRFDDIFFVGLPSAKERQAIFSIHLAGRGRIAGNFESPELLTATHGFSGAEIEQTIVAGLFRAFEQERDLELGDLLLAASETHPLSRSRSREIGVLTAWARKNAKPASSGSPAEAADGPGRGVPAKTP